MRRAMTVQKDKAKNSSDEGSLNELAASIASKLVRNAVPLADPQPGVPQEGVALSSGKMPISHRRREPKLSC